MMKFFVSIATLIIISANTFAQSAITLLAEKDYPITPADYGLKFEEIKIETPDKKSDNTPVNLFGWHLIPNDKTSKKAIIIAGDGQGNMSYMMDYAGVFLGQNFHVFMFDYRGYGKSDEFNVSNKFYIYAQFATDLNATVDFVKKYYATYSIDVFGKGIGGGLALGVGANSPKVYRVIADSPYTTLETVEKRYATKTGGKLFMPIAYDKALIEPINALTEKGDHLRGILLIVGANGEYSTPADIDAIAALKKKVTIIYTVPGVTNDQTYMSNKDVYFNTVKSFYDKYGGL
ncbi:MAG: alpha/beta hydrolase [Fimbriimonadaceae bacterium]|nr:alpha/beta hydrolase [Chitinophagales bacterium]